MSRQTMLIAGAAGVAAGAAVAAFALLRRRRTPPLALPPGPELVDDPTADEPIFRETRYDEELDVEEQRRHEASDRLRSDPLTERLEDDNGA